MSNRTAQLLDEFNALPENEKRAFTAEFFRRVIPFDSGPLDDDETAHAANNWLAACAVSSSSRGPESNGITLRKNSAVNALFSFSGRALNSSKSWAVRLLIPSA